jgi:steroid delta-isomerase-like uncharacterized protein
MSGDLQAAGPDLDALFDAWELIWSGSEDGVSQAAITTALNKICSSEVQYEDPLTAEPLYGTDQIARHAARLQRGFPNARLQQLGPRLGDGRMAVAPCKLTGTHTGPLAGIPASGNSLTVQIVFYCELRGARIHRARAFFDVYGAAVQLGVLPGRGSLGERALMVVRGFGWRR